MSYCEDYPCCGHTPADPCEPQWYDAPDAFDTSVNPHAFCDHESGDCAVADYYDDMGICPDCGEDEWCKHNQCAYCCTPCNEADAENAPEFRGIVAAEQFAPAYDPAAPRFI